jgi:hypothetical protein
VTVSPGSRGASLRRLLDDLDPPSAAVIVSGEESDKIASATLRMLGYRGDSGAVVVTRGEIAPSTHAVIFFDAPATRSELAGAAAATPVSVIALLEPRELSSLRRMAGADVTPFTLSAPGNAARERETLMRRELSAILDSGVPSRELLALEPLLERYDGIEIAAAALRLLDKERTVRRAVQAEIKAQKEAGPRPAAPESGTFERRPPPSRGGAGGDRRPSFGGSREGSRGHETSRGGPGARGFDRGAPKRDDRERPPRDGGSRDAGRRGPPKRDRS